VTGWDVLLALLFVLGCPAPRWLCDACPWIPIRCGKVYESADLLGENELHWLDVDVKRAPGRFGYVAGREGHLYVRQHRSALELMPDIVGQRSKFPPTWAADQFPSSEWIEEERQFLVGLCDWYEKWYHWLPPDRRTCLERIMSSGLDFDRVTLLIARDKAKGHYERRRNLQVLLESLGPDNFWQGRLKPILLPERFTERP
jgi:hypothetical protein